MPIWQISHLIPSTNFNQLWFCHSTEFCCVRKFIINHNLSFLPVRKLIKFSLTHYMLAKCVWWEFFSLLLTFCQQKMIFLGWWYSITSFNSCMIYLNVSHFKRSFIIILLNSSSMVNVNTHECNLRCLHPDWISEWTSHLTF